MRPVTRRGQRRHCRRLGTPDVDGTLPATENLTVNNRVTRISGDELRRSAQLQTEIRNTVAPHYVDPDALLEREFSKCTDCYLGRWGDDSVHAFFMVRWNLDAHRVFLGLSGTSMSARRSGLVHQLYLAFIHDARAWEIAARSRLLLWGTTATPVALRVVQTMFADAAPRTDGSHTLQEESLVRTLLPYLGAVVSPGDHPFVAREIATATRYSLVESQRNGRYAHEHGIDLLDRLGVREEHGDRLVFLCRVPAPSNS